MQTHQEVDRLRVWISHAISPSVALESFRMDDSSREEADVKFDDLADDLTKRHGETLRSLHLKSCFIGADALRNLCTRCVNLRELEVAVDENGLVRVSLNCSFAGPH